MILVSSASDRIDLTDAETAGRFSWPAHLDRSVVDRPRETFAGQVDCRQPAQSDSAPTVADVLRGYWPGYLKTHRALLSEHEIHVMGQLVSCRTEELGGSVWMCADCGHEHSFYHSCGHRQCPTCGTARRNEWLERMLQDALPVPYVHIVMTVPHDELSDLAQANRRLLYNLLFQATREAIQKLAARVWGIKVGGGMVLHTWGQKGLFHMHTHTLVPAGGPSPDGTRWISCADPDNFLDRQELMEEFRTLFLAGLEKLYRDGKLNVQGVLAEVGESLSAFRQWLAQLGMKDWVVNAQGPPERLQLQGPDAAISYLSRYITGTAISDGRILSDDGRFVTFQAKDYRDNGNWITLKVTGEEFVRRFLLHILPKQFMRVRYFGFLSPRCKKTDLAACRRLLAENGEGELGHETGSNKSDTESPFNGDESQGDETEVEYVGKCPHCGKRGTLRWQGEFTGTRGWQRYASLLPNATKRRIRSESQGRFPAGSPP